MIFSVIEINITIIVFKMEGLKMEDKKILCKDCGSEFVFTVGEQEFYKEKGFDNEPVRCPACRKARKAQNNRR